jgi:hypothetical protein
MNTLRILGLSLAVVAGMLLISGALGFSSTTADRNVSVAVVEDDEAFVGYDEVPHAQSDFIISVVGEPEHSLVEIENRFASPIEITDVESESDNVEVELTDKPTSVEAGSSLSITGRLTCSDTFIAIEQVGITVKVEAPSVEAELGGETSSREFTVLCISNPFDGLEFNHPGSEGRLTARTAQFASEMGLGEDVAVGQQVQAELAIANENGTVGRVSGQWTVPRGNVDTDLGNGYKLVEVELQEQNVIFRHPNWRALSKQGTGSIDIEAALNSPELDTFEPD